LPTTTILLTNDDGVDAPGLRAIERAFAEAGGTEVWIVAPEQERSACGHGLTLDRPLGVERLGERRFSTTGLTADCVYFALFGCMPRRPDVVVSGINGGPNLGSDVIYSGTVAGAREAVIRGVSGIAASLVSGGGFDDVARSVAAIALRLASLSDGRPRLLNLNYPPGPFVGPTLAPLGRRRYPQIVEKLTAALGGGPCYRIGGPPVEDEEVEGTDGWLVARGIASATFLRLDQTDQDVAGGAILGVPGEPEEEGR
jgi:5'-nucleotidase